MNALRAPYGYLAMEVDAAAAKRREIADRLKRGEDVNITPTGQVIEPDDPKAKAGKTLKAPEGKLA